MARKKRNLSREPLTGPERCMALALRPFRGFSLGTKYEGRFVRWVLAEGAQKGLTAGQRKFLHGLVARYRERLLATAGRLACDKGDEPQERATLMREVAEQAQETTDG